MTRAELDGSHTVHGSSPHGVIIDLHQISVIY